MATAGDHAIPSISRRHALLTWQGKQLYIQDLNSSSGTKVNGRLLVNNEQKALYNDSEIRLGNLSLWVEIKNKEEELLQTCFFSNNEDNKVALSSDVVVIREALLQNLKNYLDEKNLSEKLIRLVDSELYNLQAQYEERLKEQRILHSISHLLNDNLSLSDLCKNVLDLSSKVLNADRGFIVLHNPETDYFEVIAQRNFKNDKKQILEGSAGSFSRHIIRQCLRENSIQIINDPHADTQLEDIHSIHASESKSIVAIPLHQRTMAIGAIYLDNQSRQQCFSQRQIPFMETFAAHTSIALNNAKLYKRAITDDLTQLFTRKYIDQRLQQELDKAIKFDKPFSVLLVDIDHFKSINDKYGHDIGDNVLRQLSTLFLNSLREFDVAGRFGGEEFIIMLAETHIKEAQSIAERLRNDVQLLSINDLEKAIKITISIGVASYNKDNNGTISQLIKDADQALYQAKKDGRNRIQLAS